MTEKKGKDRPVAHRVGWSEEEEQYLMDNMTWTSITDITEHLGRTEVAVRAKYRHMLNQRDEVSE